MTQTILQVWIQGKKSEDNNHKNKVKINTNKKIIEKVLENKKEE